MIITSGGDTEMNSMCSLPHVHPPSASSSIYGGGAYVLDSPWHTKQHDIKQETDDLYNNDSGVSPSHFSDNNNASPISYCSDGQQSSPDSGNPDKSYHHSPSRDCSDPNDESLQTNATIGILARPILKMSPPYRPSSAEKQPDETSRSSVSDVEGVYEDGPLRKLQMALQKTEMMDPDLQSDTVNGEKPMKCPLCEFSTVLRSDFNDHLKTHSNQVNCSQCEFTADNTEMLREHLKNIHDTTMEDEARRWAEVEEPGVNTPKINSQGKVKTYRCKQCDYTAVTKLDFWDHSRQHIRTERLLTCPKCPFVTEYKHHLEYHLRNHFGSKPFKCNQCPYSCVNKSMLNSHLKSHSTVYQFRCANCTYATKYCHSLKIHLRKYSHTPAMVLNPDGTPNPLPIIDIYGTRRGPKTKPRNRVKNSSSPPPIQHSPVSPIFPSPFTFMPNPTMSFPMNAILNPFSTINPVHCENRSSPVADELTSADTDQSVLHINNNKESMNAYFARIVTMQQEILSRTQHNIEDLDRTPLDLSRPESAEQQTTTKSRRKGKAFKLIQHSEDVEDLDQSSIKKKRVIFSEQDTELVNKISSSPPKQSLPVRYPLSPDHVDKDIPPGDPEPSIMSPKVDFSEPINNEFKSAITTERKERWKNIKEIYDCAYCDLLFGDVVMYTMHMGYHGYQNPFTCNICGLQTSDKVQFFLHLFRVNHD